MPDGGGHDGDGVELMLPAPLLGIDRDNGSEFINRGLYAYCQEQGITLTRSRPYRKNDAAQERLYRSLNPRWLRRRIEAETETLLGLV